MLGASREGLSMWDNVLCEIHGTRVYWKVRHFSVRSKGNSNLNDYIKAALIGGAAALAAFVVALAYVKTFTSYIALVEWLAPIISDIISARVISGEISFQDFLFAILSVQMGAFVAKIGGKKVLKISENVIVAISVTGFFGMIAHYYMVDYLVKLSHY